MRKLFVLTLLLAFSYFANAQTADGRLRLIFAGDIMGHAPQMDAALLADGTYDYSPCFRFVKDYIESADIAVANLEVTLAGKPYSSYPCFSSPDALAEAAKNAGFDILATANNHCMDKGRNGLERTLRALDTLGIAHLGTYRDMDSRLDNHPLIVEKNGFRLAFLCYTYGTNGISVQHPNVVNYIDSALILRDLKAARHKGADFIITMIHWGIEYQTHSNAEQEGLAKWLFAQGSDVVIGGHPHVVQNLSMDVNPDNDRYPELVVYSMGNLVSNQRDENTDGGIMVELELEKKQGRTSIFSCGYMPYWVHRGYYGGLKQYYIVPSTDAVEHPGTYQITDEEYKALKVFHSNTNARLSACAPIDTMRTFMPASAWASERRFYHDGHPSKAICYTYNVYDYNRDHIDTVHLWVNSFMGQTSIVEETTDGPHIPGYAVQSQYVDLEDDVWFTVADFDDGERMNYQFSPFSNPNYYEWDTIPSNGPDTRFVTTVNSNRIDITVHRNGEDVSPLPSYRRLPGLVTKMSRNGQVQLELAQIDTLTSAHSVIPMLKGKFLTPNEFSNRKKEKMILTTSIFDNQQVHWGAKKVRWTEKGPADPSLPDSLIVDALPCDTTIHFAGGTLIMKRMQMPILPKHYQYFLELHQHSNGDAYDRSGSVFVVPRDCAQTFFEGVNQHPDSLPLFVGHNGSKYQGIRATEDYLPPVELMRFFTPFGVGHYNGRVQIDGLEWADEAYYKQEVTDLATYLQGDVWIGLFLGNYDGGGHRVTLDLKAYPQDEIWVEEESQDWTLPLFNTCNVLEMAGQNYGRLFATDTLTVSFCVPENVENMKLRFISTGHGGWDGGDEFNPKENLILIDGERAFTHTPWRCDCATYRHLNPVSGNFWNGVSSSDYSRSGWCPGTSTPPVYFDLSYLTPGHHTLSLVIPQGADFEGSFSHWMCSAVLLGIKK